MYGICRFVPFTIFKKVIAIRKQKTSQKLIIPVRFFGLSLIIYPSLTPTSQNHMVSLKKHKLTIRTFPDLMFDADSELDEVRTLLGVESPAV